MKMHFNFCMKPLIDRFVIDVNDAIHKGRLPPKSKMPQHVPRMATTLLVFNYSMVQLLAGTCPINPSTPTNCKNNTGKRPQSLFNISRVRRTYYVR